MKKKFLIFKPLKFYSEEDENLFFSWINKIECIKNYKGVGRHLELTVLHHRISFNDYRNLYGLFKRYRLKDIHQLEELFKNDENQDWFEK